MSRALETPFDSIFALASVPGRAERAVLRCSGPLCREALERICVGELRFERQVVETGLELVDGGHPLPCVILVFEAPASYTGEDALELHFPSSPALVETVEQKLRELGLRRAWPGEFTRRAFENGKMGLAEAERVRARIEAEDLESLRVASVASGESRESELMRRVLDLLALLEGGLDFEDGETGELSPDEWLPRLDALADELKGHADARGSQLERTLRPAYLLLGYPNAGKTSLCNALHVQGNEGLVSRMAGTTRDLRYVDCGGFLLGDAPGLHRSQDSRLDREIFATEARICDAQFLVVPATEDRFPIFEDLPRPDAILRSKSDLLAAGDAPMSLGMDPAIPELRVSARSGEGLEDFRRFAASLDRKADAVSRMLADLQHRYGRAASHVLAARAAAEALLPAECLAEELRVAHAELAPLEAQRAPEEVLDRIFSRFCLGK